MVHLGYTAFIIDVFVRRIVGWKVSNRMNIDMVMAALNQAIADRNNPKDVIHRSDRGVQYLSIRYTDKMADSGVITFVGTRVIHMIMHSTIGYVSPFEFEKQYYDSLNESGKVA